VGAEYLNVKPRFVQAPTASFFKRKQEKKMETGGGGWWGRGKGNEGAIEG
jgi:hypothetical protein